MYINLYTYIVCERDDMRFGEYFKTLRRSKGFTQEQIASCIGKSKMLVSGVETGRNDAFLDDDLERIADFLKLSEEEESTLFFEATKARSRLPAHILEYMSRYGEIYGLLELLAKENMGEKDIKELKQFVEEMKNAKND